MCLCGHVPNEHEIGPTNAWTKLSVGHENIRIRTILWCRHVHPFPNKSPYRHPIIYCPTAISFRYVKRKVRLFEIRVIATKISYEIGPSINICTIHEHVSHNNRSCATMVIYSCKWVNVPYRWNGAGAGICVQTIIRHMRGYLRCHNNLARVRGTHSSIKFRLAKRRA